MTTPKPPAASAAEPVRELGADAEAISAASSAPEAASGHLSLTSRAHALMREDIISGALVPGQKLKIEDLRQRYGIGASPIREALSLLTSDQLVERIDQRGFRVARVSVAEYEELLRTRIWLEERALRESIAQGGADWEEQVVLATYRLSRVPRAGAGDGVIASEEWEARHRHFHMVLLSACGSSILQRFCGQLYDQNTRYRHLAVPVAYPERDITEEHSAICDAALARDADKAVSLLEAHYRQTGTYLKRAL